MSVCLRQLFLLEPRIPRIFNRGSRSRFCINASFDPTKTSEGAFHVIILYKSLSNPLQLLILQPQDLP